MTEWAIQDHDDLVTLRGETKALHKRVDRLETNIEKKLDEIHDAIAVQRDWRNRQLGAIALGSIVLTALGAFLSKTWEKLTS